MPRTEAEPRAEGPPPRAARRRCARCSRSSRSSSRSATRSSRSSTNRRAATCCSASASCASSSRSSSACIVPPVRVRDNIQLGSQEYVVRMRGVRVAGGEMLPRHLLALDTGATTGTPEGVVRPATRASACARCGSCRTSARPPRRSARTWSRPPTVLATHLMEIIREHAAELLTRQNVREMLDGLKETHPALVEDVVPGKLSLGVVHRVLQRLLKEGLPVRDLATVLEVLSDAAEHDQGPRAAHRARAPRAVSAVIAQMLGGEGQTMRAITSGRGSRWRSCSSSARGRARTAARSSPRSSRARCTRCNADRHRVACVDGQYPPLVTPPGPAPRHPPPGRTDPAAPARHLARRAADADADPDPSHLGAEPCRLKS